MQPYISVAAALVPELVSLIEGDRAGTLEPTIARTVADTTRAATAADAMKAVKANDKLASQLESRLRKIAAVAEKIQSEDVLLLNEEWATAPPAAAPSTTETTALEWRKLRLEERITALREEEFLRTRANASSRGLVIAAAILAVAIIGATAIFAVQDALSGFARATAANADLAAAETYLAAAQLTQSVQPQNPTPVPVSAPAPKPVSPPPSPSPAQREASAFTALASTPPVTLFTCAAPTAAAKLIALTPSFPSHQHQLAALYLQVAADCAPPDHKLTRTQYFYAAASALGPPIPLTTIYIFYPSPIQAQAAQALAAKLQQNPTYFVPPPQQSPPGIAPRRPEINYYTPSDAPLAQALASETGLPHTQPNFFHEHLPNIPKGVLEIWFPRNS